jgi:hypothetical protein
MPQFYFHLRDELGLHPDDLGTDFPDVETAYLEAFAGATGLWAQMLREQRDPRRSRFEVANAAGQPLFELLFTEVLETAAKGAPKPTCALVLAARDRAERLTALTQGLTHEIAVSHRLVQETRDLLGQSRARS